MSRIKELEKEIVAIRREHYEEKRCLKAAYDEDIARLTERNFELDKASQLNLQTIQNLIKTVNDQLLAFDTMRREELKNKQLFDAQSYMEDRLRELEIRNDNLLSQLSQVKNKEEKQKASKKSLFGWKK